MMGNCEVRSDLWRLTVVVNYKSFLKKMKKVLACTMYCNVHLYCACIHYVCTVHYNDVYMCM